MKRKFKTDVLKILFLISILVFSAGNVSAAQWEVGSNQLYTTIQSAINNANTTDGDVLNVHSGTYAEDVVVNKRLTVQANEGDTVEVQPINTGFTVVNDSTGDGSGSTVNGFDIGNSPNGTGVNISADNCTVKNNQINGGETGIAVSGANTTLVDNIISGQSEAGIMGNLSRGSFTASGNYIYNLIGDGLVEGITVSTHGNLSDFNINGNTISNITSLYGAAFGVQLGKSTGPDGNPEVANVTNLRVTGNIISFLSAVSATMGMELISNSINAVISNNEVSHLQGTINSSVFAVEAVIVGYGPVLVSKNLISQITSDEKAAGIVAVAMGDLKLEDNLISNISKSKVSVAMLGLGLFSNVTMKNNSATDITSSSTAAGIIGVTMQHLNALYNAINGVKGVNAVSMVTVGFNNTQVLGNNLEGNGSGIGIVICSPNGTINYNRIANYEYYIQNFLFSNFGPSIDEMLKPIDDAIQKHPELEPILKPIRDDMDKMFHKMENSNTTATYNWYGTNTPANTKFYKGNGTLNYTPWLVLNINASPSTVSNGESSTITGDVYQDSEGGNHSDNASMFFSGSQVTLTTNLGDVGSKSVTVPWVNGLSTAILRADEGAGIATVTATDYETVQTFVTILGASDTSTTSVTPTGKTVDTFPGKTVGMQETGTPLTALLLAILLIFSGMGLKRQ